MEGKIVRLVSDRGFGFIRPDDGSKDIFMHASGLKSVEFDSLCEGERVSFDTEQGDKGLKAVNIRVIPQ